MRTKRKILTVVMMIAAVGLLASAAQAATLTTSQTAPTVDGADIASGAGATAAWSKYWIWDGDVPGQTFTIGSDDVELKAITLRVWETSGSIPTKTHELTIGEISGNTFTSVLAVEQAAQGPAEGPWISNDWVTFTLDTPVPMSANGTYGFDLVMTADNAGWRSGIPYLHAGDNLYAGGQRFSGGRLPTVHISPFNFQRGDLVFHLDMDVAAPPTNIEVTGSASGGSKWGLESFFEGPNVLVVDKIATDRGPFDIEILATGLAQIVADEAILNEAGEEWTDFHFILGYGLGDQFEQGDGSDGLHFLPGSLSDLFPNAMMISPTELKFQGAVLYPGADPEFLLNINVPDDGRAFTLRQVPSVPEPATMALCALAVAGLGGYVRRRRMAQ